MAVAMQVDNDPNLLPAVPDTIAEEAPVVPLELLPPANFSLRLYQTELLVWTWLDFKEGRGTLAYLPTGAGKTLLAASVTSMMHSANSRKRVAFIVDKVPLMHQQAQSLQSRAGLQTVAICGAISSSTRKRLLRESFDVLVATAQVFADMLKKGELKVAQFSLVVIDEAHHCTGNHPYTNLMTQYRLCALRCRPRLLALSASPGSTEKELQLLEDRLQACFRCPSRPEALAVLRDVVSPPNLQWLSSQTTAAMDKFESLASKALDCLVPGIARVLGEELPKALTSAPQGRLAAWQALRGFAERECSELLNAGVWVGAWVAEAAEVNLRLGDSHASEFLRKTSALDASRKLDAGVQPAVQELISWSQVRGGDAPHLSQVVGLLREKAKQRQDFRAVIFVSTRALAKQVANLLQERLPEFGAEWLIGQEEGPGEKCQQDEVLSRFRDGTAKLLVATSVAEEGLDVAECCLVVRLQAVHSLAAHVQSRGRARAKDSLYVVVGSTKDRQRLDQLSAAEEHMQRLAEDRMTSIPHQTQEEVLRCSAQMEKGSIATVPKAISQTLAHLEDPHHTNVLSIVVHGLRSGIEEEPLALFSAYGQVLSCCLEGPGLHLPDSVRPAGHTAVIQLQHSSSLSCNELMSSVINSTPRIWLRHIKTADVANNKKDPSCCAAADVNVGSLISSSAFVVQARLQGATVRMSPNSRAINIRFETVDRRSFFSRMMMDDDDTPTGLRAQILLSALADCVLVDGLSVFLLLTQPPKFWEERRRGRRTVQERCCMPPAHFGSSFTYALQFRNQSDLEACITSIVSKGIRICYARVECANHSLKMLEFPVDWDEDCGAMDVDWDEYLEDALETHELARISKMIELLRALNSPDAGVWPTNQGHTANFNVLWALLCALGEEPLALCSALSPQLVSALRRLPPGHASGKAAAAVLPRQLGGRLFVGQDVLVEALQKEASAVTAAMSDEVPANNVSVRGVMVTPTRYIFQPAREMLSNRVLREFGEPHSGTAERFLRVMFRDEDGSPLVGKALEKRMQEVFDRGIRVGDRHFKYLHWSNSQMRSASLWLYASDGRHSCERIRAWVFPDPEKAPKTTSKYASRMALFFSSSSPSIRINHLNTRVIEDVKRNDFCFTDGSGKIRQDVADKIAKSLGLEYAPSAFQIRYGGAKGVVVVYPASSAVNTQGSPTCIAELELRDSMVKFESLHDSLEVLNWSRTNAATLNQQIILLLVARGVPDGVFLQFHEKALLENSQTVVDPQRASQRLSGSYKGLAATGIRELDSAGVDFTSEPFFSSLLKHLYRQDVQKLRCKTSIPIEEAALLLGVPDESCKLNYGEVFIQVTERTASGGSRFRIIEGPVMVTKNPCLHPGDILRLQAVDCPSLHCVKDCVVFPVNGDRPHPDESSGSDLDGDLYFCTWSPDLVPTTTWNPMDFVSDSPPEPKPAGGVGEQDLQQYFIRSCTSTSLGVIANAHKVHADSRGAGSNECLKLAKLHSDAVDAPKTGQVVELPSELKVDGHPAWMEKTIDEAEDNEAEQPASQGVTQRDTLLQRLHDQCPRVSTTAVETEVAIDSWFVLPGHEEFLEGARRVRLEYNGEMLQLLRRHGARWESEILTGTFEQRRNASGSLEDRIEQARSAVEAYRLLAMRYRDRFFEGLNGDRGGLSRESADEIQRKASAWYVATYTQPDYRRCRFLSFAWIMADQLLTIPRGQTNDEPQAAGGKLLESLAESMTDLYKKQTSRQKSLTNDSPWRHADLLCSELKRVFIDVIVEPWGLDGLGLKASNQQLQFAVCTPTGLLDPERTARALRGTRPKVRVEEHSVVHIGSEQPIRLYLGESAQKVVSARRHLCGWLSRCPELVPILHVLLAWSDNQGQWWPIQPVQFALLFIENLRQTVIDETPDAMLDAPAESDADPSGWASHFTPTVVLGLLEQKPWLLQNATAMHPGRELLGFLLNLLETSKQDDLHVHWPGQKQELLFRRASPQMLQFRVALLRAYQQLCLDRHASSLAEGSGSPHLRSANFQIRNVPPGIPISQLQEQLQAVGGLGVKAWLDYAGPQPAIRIEARGSREELNAVETLVAAQRQKIKALARSRRLAESWSGAKLLVEIKENRDQILAQVRARRVIVICASTGSGKSTGVPKMMLEEHNVLAPKRIICTQPRRIGATSLAKRVADLTETQLGDDVGYHIGGAAHFKPGRTQLVYKTTAIAMAQFLQEPGKTPCTHLIVDEIQNRSMFDDILLAAVKHNALKQDKQLKVILMSAATDCNKLAQYFADEHGPAPVVRLEGSPHGIVEHCLDDIDFFCEQRISESPGPEQVAKFIWHLHQIKKLESKFLVFLAGRADINRLRAQLEDVQEDYGEALDIKLLYGGVAVEQQQQSMQEVKQGYRVVILATDVVESSVTIPDVDVVVDSCLHKRRCWNNEKRDHELALKLISKDEALQRRGRTGRLRPGEVFRLIRRYEYDSLSEHAAAQMESASISEVLLLLSESPCVEDPAAFLREKVISPPLPRQVNEAYMQLRELGAIMGQSNTVTPLGHLLQKLPLQAELGLLVWTGLKLGIHEDCEVLAGLVQRGSPFLANSPGLRPGEVLHALQVRRFCCPDSDLLGGLRAFKAWRKFLATCPSPEEENDWCQSHYLSATVLQEVAEMCNQIREKLAELGHAKPPSEDEFERIRRRSRWSQTSGRQSSKRQLCGDPVASLRRLLDDYNPEDPQYRKAKFCIGLAFLPSFVILEGAPATRVVYKCFRRPVKPLPSFLQTDFKLRLVGVPKPMQKGDVAVTFQSAEQAQLALQLGSCGFGSGFPYSQAPTSDRRAAPQPRECYKSSQIVLGADSICLPTIEHRTALVAAKVLLVEGKSNNSHFMFSDLTVVPPDLLGPLLAVRAGGSFNSMTRQAEAVLRDHPEKYEVLSGCVDAVISLRKSLSSANLPALGASPAVLKIMAVTEHAAKRASENLKPVRVDLPQVPSNQFHKIIGPKGSTISRLRQSYPGVHVHVPGRGESGCVWLEGPPSAVSVAKQDVCRIVGVSADVRNRGADLQNLSFLLQHGLLGGDSDDDDFL